VRPERTTPEFVRADPAWLAELARMAEACQQDPERHCTYAGLDTATIAADVADIASWESSITAAVATTPDGPPSQVQVLGWILADVDEELARVWWWGPFVGDADWAGIADLLYERARADLIDRIPAAGDFAEEMAVDSRAVVMQEFATRHGFHAEEASACLVVTPEQLTMPGSIDVELRQLGPGTPDTVLDAVVSLHDTLFPNSHLPGARLADADDRHDRLVAMSGDEVAGYVALERQPDDSLYVDFVGVAPEHARRGVGRTLVAESCRRAFAAGATHAHLTVRTSNLAARSLYRSLGFEEERVLVPLRRGVIDD
jgi:ribosomal protein S18 acetylase RimI-like enzyme